MGLYISPTVLTRPTSVGGGRFLTELLKFSQMSRSLTKTQTEIQGEVGSDPLPLQVHDSHMSHSPGLIDRADLSVEHIRLLRNLPLQKVHL